MREGGEEGWGGGVEGGREGESEEGSEGGREGQIGRENQIIDMFPCQIKFICQEHRIHVKG